MNRGVLSGWRQEDDAGPLDFAAGIVPTSNVGYSNIGNITDRNDATAGSATSATMPQWVQVDLGSAKAVKAMRVLFADSGHTSTTGRLEYSSDAANWVGAASWDADAAIEKTRSIVVPVDGGARYWRLLTAAVLTSGFGCDIKTLSLFG